MAEVRDEFARATALHQQGKLSDAERIYRAVLDLAPNHFGALHLLGAVALQTDRPNLGVELIAKAIGVNGAFSSAHCNLGTGLRALRRFDEALDSYDKALALKPDDAEAWFNRGVVLRDLRRHAEAVASFDKAIELRPNYADAHGNRGNGLRDLKQFEAALASYDRAIAVRPDSAEAYGNRATVLLDLKRPDEALASCAKAIALQPKRAESWYNRGIVLRDMNRWREAVASFQSAIAARPDFAAARLAACVAELPHLYMEEAEIPARRAAYATHLRAMCEAADRAENAADFADGIGISQPYFLPYQGYNDRDLQATYGSLVCRTMARRYPPAALAPPPAPTEPVRVGIVSGFFNRHSNWKIPIKGWLSQLDRRRFRLFGYHTSGIDDSETKVAAGLCDRFVQGPLSIDRWRAEILTDAPHVLIYPEVGIDSVSVVLASQRLAAVQCNSWGHPETSGFPTLDYYLSADLMEPPDGQDHYTERLIRLPNISVYCDPVDPGPATTLDIDFGLRPTATLYWCCQSLFKYLPQFDAVFPRIARAVGDCQFIFIQDELPHITALFRQRLGRAFGTIGLEADEYCVFLPHLGQYEFLAAASRCHVFLDSIGWSGCNTTLESLPFNQPIVTLPGQFMRGRHGMAILGMIGVTETIAATLDDYVSIAARLAVDVAWRMEIKARMAANKHRVHRDSACISGLERFLDDVARGGVAQYRTRKAAPSSTSGHGR